jgi:AcrR family transcriptional regulator
MSQATSPEVPTSVTRQRILQAALKLFGQRGYTRTTTRALAAEAGVNEVTLFRHFGSKKNLLLAAVELFNEAGLAGSFEQELSGDYARDIAHLAERQAHESAEAFEMLRLLLCEAALVPEVLEAGQQGAQSNLEKLAGYFQQQIDAGVVRPNLDPLALAFALESFFSTSYLVPRMLEPEGPPELPEGLRWQLVDIFVRGTINPQEKS